MRPAAGTTGTPSFLEWTTRISEPKTGPLNFDRWPFQRELYDTDFTYMDEARGDEGDPGRGSSAWLVRWSLFFQTQGLDGALRLPNDKQLAAFSNERIRNLIRKSDYLEAAYRPTGSTTSTRRTWAMGG